MVYDRKFTVDAKYQPKKPIGRGAYGIVWYVQARPSVLSRSAIRTGVLLLCCVDCHRSSAIDKTTGRQVAIKKIPNAFDDLIDAKRILREIKLLRHFNHDNVCTRSRSMMLQRSTPLHATLHFTSLHLTSPHLWPICHLIRSGDQTVRFNRPTRKWTVRGYVRTAY